jgi:hypothetical protein
MTLLESPTEPGRITWSGKGVYCADGGYNTIDWCLNVCKRCTPDKPASSKRKRYTHAHDKDVV